MLLKPYRYLSELKKLIELNLHYEFIVIFTICCCTGCVARSALRFTTRKQRGRRHSAVRRRVGPQHARRGPRIALPRWHARAQEIQLGGDWALLLQPLKEESLCGTYRKDLKKKKMSVQLKCTPFFISVILMMKWTRMVFAHQKGFKPVHSNHKNIQVVYIIQKTSKYRYQPLLTTI